MRRTRIMAILTAVIAAAMLATLAPGQDAPDSDPATPEADDVMDQLMQKVQRPTTQPATTQPQSQAVMDDLEKDLQANPMIQPAQRRPGSDGPAIQLGIDPEVLGTAPGMDPPRLRREGEFVISRRGRLVRSTNTNQAVFVFESDGKQLNDPPMVLVPCQTLQSMEELVQQRGDRIVFILSGQILEYRGVNYLLPTMMKLDFDRGNLDK